jgi:pimeloyl-ACP methyl ester carboxylesterase
MTDNLNRIQIPGRQVKAVVPPQPAKLFPELKVQDAYEIQSVSRDGSAAPVISLDADKLKGRVVELEFENGQKLWVSGERLLEKLGEVKQREDVIRKRSGSMGAASPADEIRLPTVWQTPAAARGITGQLILKGLKFIGFDPASALAKEVKNVGVQHIENQLAEGSLDTKLSELNKGVDFDEASGECSGWLFPFTEELKPAVAQQIKQAKQLVSGEPYLLFLHGTASSSNGSFGQLVGTAEWKQLRADYAGRILAFEHRSLSASPIKNVLDLLALLPDGARLHLVSHSRGGLLGELLCLSQVVKRDEVPLNELLAIFDKGVDNSEASQETRAAQREMLQRLWETLGRKQLRIERFVRVACPARGTTWLAENLDYFFSALLHSVELVPGLAQNPIYDFIKATMTALVQMRKQPAELPGLEAMMPASPLVAFLNHPALVTTANLAVIKGDSSIGGSVGSSLLTLLTNTVLWEKNDWVVNTRAMDGGMKRNQAAYQFLDTGSDVSHFNYFFNPDTRSRLAVALKSPLTEQPKGFETISRAVREIIDVTAARSALAPGNERGTVFVLPGIMGSELQVDGKDIWLQYLALLRGGMEQLALNLGARDVKPTGLMASDYKRLIEQLSRTYRVEPFAYDWRHSVKAAGERLGLTVQAALARTDKPVYLLAHSMGGLVARSMIVSHKDVWQEIGKRQGRLIMLGTPNNGAPAIARMLLGEEKLLKQLALLDLKHSRAELLNILRDFPGVLDLLPQEYFAGPAWQALKAPAPDREKLAAASEWRDQLATAIDPARMIYVAGQAERTPLQLQLNDDELEVIETNQGDGRVPYEKYGRLANVPTYYAEVIHGKLADEPAIFPALFDLLEQGRTERLPRQSRAERGAPALEIITRARETQEIAPVYPTETDLYEALSGGSLQPAPTTSESAYTLQLSVMHGHLRYAKNPVAVGHYGGESLVGAEAVLNQVLEGRLKARLDLNVYPGLEGTAEVVYVRKDHLPPGALVIGLGEVGGVNADIVKRGVTAAALRHALHLVSDPLRPEESRYRSAAFSTLLIGTYGGRALTVAEAVEAIVAGAVQANRMLQAQGLWDRVRIDKIEFVEIFEDVAIQAMQAVQRLREQPLADFGEQVNVQIEPPLLKAQRGGRYQRLVYLTSSDWWRRIQIVSNNQSQDVDPNADVLLEFTTLTDRARAEGQQLAISRYWIDQLIQKSVSDTRYQSEFAATLFELLVPDNLKRHTEPVSLVLDHTSAQYPWELLAERSQPGKPVVTQIGMLRQFKALDYWPSPIRARGRNAFVIGDTAGHEFGELLGAQQEATQVATALKTSQYEVRSFIKPAGLEVITELFAREYQILHIAAHGIFDLGSERRQGIVLGKDQYLTTTEIEKLRAVPDLVFINCCHLGKLDTQAASDQRQLSTPYPHRLAASIAEELIKIGVKAVVAAGWAVDDHAALTFATEFYRQMLDGVHYGEAVLKARQKTYQLHKETNTWGAYQCYGNPAFVLESDGSKSWGSSAPSFYSRREYRDEIKSIAEQPEANDPSQNVRLIERVQKLQGALPPELKDGEMLMELANAWRELGQYGEAIAVYEAAVAHSDARASLLSIERLANLLCRMVDDGWYEAEAKGGVLQADKQQKQLAQLAKANGRLQWLISMFAKTAERVSLHARVHKSLALIETSPVRSRRALVTASNLYREASELGVKNGQPRDNYPTFNWLACAWLLHKAANPASRTSTKRRPGVKANAVASRASEVLFDSELFEQLLDECVEVAQAKLATKEDFWVRVAIPEAVLLRHLLKGELLVQKAAVIVAYQKAFATGARPSEVDSVLGQIDFIRTMLNRQAKTEEQKALVATLHEIKVTLLAGLRTDS